MSFRNAELKQELTDYFLRQGRFRKGRRLTGMSGSQYGNFFLDYFRTLSAEDKAGMVDILVGTIIRENPEFSQQGVMSLLGRLAIDRQTENLKPHMETLERIFLDPANLDAWANSDDVFQSRGREYLLSWRFGLALCCILKRIGSVKVDQGYDFLLAHAKSAHFQEVLKGNWQLIVERGL